MEIDFDDLKVQGTKVNYYYVCKRKLWLFSKQITMEHTSDRVLQGKILHDVSYTTKKKEMTIDDLIQVDLIDDKYVGEVKSSRKMFQADQMQLLYYLYYLKQMEIHRKGRLHYVRERKVDHVTLTEELEKQVVNCLRDIKAILDTSSPPKLEKLPYCKNCAYYLFCYIGVSDLDE